MAQNTDIGTAVVSEMSSSDQVIKFLLENKIQRGVVDEIIERGFDSLEALSLLDPEDIKSQKIPVGQRRLLVHVTKSLNSGGNTLQKADHGSQPTASTSNDIAQPVVEEHDDIYSQTIINSLVAQQTQLSNSQSPSSGPLTNNNITPASAPNSGIDNTQPSWQDPQIHIATATGKSGLLYLDVCDFVPHSVEEELVIGGQGEQQVVVKSGPKKPKLETLSLSQWSIANLSILYKLSSEGKLAGPALMDYLSYTTKIYQLVQKCNLASVLLYDREYRQLQASMGFRWGTDVQHLHMLHLQPRDRQVKSATQTQPVRKSPNNFQTQPQKFKGDIGICKSYNSEKGCSFQKCRYLHQCILPGCNSKHPVTSHLGKN